jgi:hypothetical protein
VEIVLQRLLGQAHIIAQIQLQLSGRQFAFQSDVVRLQVA